MLANTFPPKYVMCKEEYKESVITAKKKTKLYTQNSYFRMLCF